MNALQVKWSRFSCLPPPPPHTPFLYQGPSQDREYKLSSITRFLLVVDSCFNTKAVEVLTGGTLFSL